MSRSKHTDPMVIRAARRRSTPYAERSAGDLSLRRRIGLQLKKLGATSIHAVPARYNKSPLRIIVQPPRRGFHHPVGKRDLLKMLDSVGPIARYGLRSIELTRTPVGASSSALAFGRYCTPGRIILFEQPFPPWRIPGHLQGTILRQFQGAGGIVTNLSA